MFCLLWTGGGSGGGEESWACEEGAILKDEEGGVGWRGGT